MLLAAYAFGQRSYVFGVVKDSASNEVLIGAHIQNIDAGSVTSANENGSFRLPAQVGDTLVISNVGYQTLAWIVDSSWYNETPKTLMLPAKTTYLDEVVIGELPEYEHFKDLIMETQPEDTSFQVFGVPKVVMNPYSQMEKKDYMSLGHIVTSPISTVHHMVSKREKEKRKMQQIRKRKYLTNEAYLKFTREWVAENTQLEGDKLTSFIAYCDFSVEYLASATLFDIQQRMLELLPQFLETYEDS